MIFKTTDDGGLTNIFKELKSVQVTFEELDKTTLRSAIKSFNNTSISVEDLSKRFGRLDNSVVEYLNNTERGQASMDGLSKSIDNSAISMISATAKAKILAIAINALAGLAISLAFKGITWAIDELIVTLDEQKEKLDEAVTAYEESKSELEKINDELKTTSERIDELNGKENLTFTEQDELEKLIKTNDELERKIYLLEQVNKEAEKEVATEAQNTYDKYTNNRTLGAVEQIEFYSDSSLLEGVNWDNFKGDLSWLVAQYKNQEEILANAQANGWTNIEERAKSNLELLEGYMSEASLDYQDLYDKIGGISDFAMTEDLELAKQDLDDILDIVAEILGYGGQRSETSFDDIWNSEDFSQYKTELETLAKEGKLDASVLESNEQYKKLLEDTGATAESTAEHIKALVAETEQAETQNPDKITVFSTESFNKEIKSYEDNYKRLIQAQEEWNETQALSPSTFVELQESGLLEYLEYTSDGLKVNTDKLLENAESCKNKAVSDLQAAMTSDMLAIAIGNTSNISDTAQSVIEQLGNNAEIAGDKALNSVADWATLGETISGVLKKAGVEDINTDQWEQMSAVYDYYKNLADNISEIDITAPERKSGDSGTKSKTKETFDWIETTISRIQRTITNLGKTVSATYKQWSTRNNTLAQEMSAINQEIATQQKAYEAYMNKANSVSLPEHYKELVRNGGLRIEDIADETVKENIKLYQEWYEKALDCEDAITDLQDSLASLTMTKFDNISKQYDDRIAMIEHHTSMLEGYVNRAEAAGFWASEVYYQKMAEKELENINQLQSKYNNLTNTLNESVSNGFIEQYSEAWFEMRIQIDDVESALQEANTALVEFNQTLQQIRWDIFDRASDYKDLFIEESNFLAELISRRDLYNEVGSLTADGLAVQGLHAVNYNAYMEQSEAFAEEILKLNEEIANDPNDLELIDRRNELIGLQQEAIENAMSEKDAIKNLISDGYDILLDSLNNLIDKRKEALNAEKDLFDYQNSIQEKTDTIASYRKQLQAYAGNNSEEAKSTIQKLQVSLTEAEKDLRETEYDKWMSDQESMLDNLYNQTEQWVNTRLDNIDGLVSEAIQATNDNTSTISGVITETAETLGYSLSEYANMLWSGDNNNTSLLLKAYEDVSLGVDVGVTRLETVLNSIDQKMQTMVEDLNAQATVESESISQPEITYNEINNYDTGDYEPPQSTSSGITFSGGTFYEDSYKGGKTGNSKNQWTGHEVEVTHESGTGMVHIVDKTTGTVLGWVDKDQLRGYATGTTNAKKGFNLVSEKGDELIRDKDGNIILAKGEQIFPFKGGETVFNAAKTAEVLSGNLIPLSAEQLWGNIVKTPKLPEMVGRNTGSNIQQDINVHFELPNVTDANSLITELQQSKRFEKIIQSMTADQMLGKGSLGKFTY